MDQLAKMIGDVSLMLQQQAATHGPATVQLTLEAARISAMQTIAYAMTALLLGVLTLGGGGLSVWSGFKAATKAEWRNDDGFARVFAGFIAVALGGITTLISAICAVNIPAWVGISRPEVYLAYQVLKKLGG